MNSYNFEVAHGYKILRGYIGADSKEEAIEAILRGEYEDIIDEFDTDELTVGYELVDIWE